MKLEEVLPALREGKGIARKGDEIYFVLKPGTVNPGTLWLEERKKGDPEWRSLNIAYFHRTCMLWNDWEVVDEA